MTEQAHPAPHRHGVSFVLMALALTAVPCLWGLRLVINYALASYFCFPGDVRRAALPGYAGWVWPTLLGVDLLALSIAAVAAVISYRSWQVSRAELERPEASLMQIGEGRTRFLALWGLIIGVGFAVGTGFDLLAIWIVPPCG